MLKLKKVFSYMAVAVLAVAGFVGCDNGLNNNTTKYTVSYSSEYGIVPNSITLDNGASLTEDQLPALKDVLLVNISKTFEGWVDSETNEKVSAGFEVTKDLKLKAKFSDPTLVSVEESALLGKAFIATVNDEIGNFYDSVVYIEDTTTNLN